MIEGAIAARASVLGKEGGMIGYGNFGGPCDEFSGARYCVTWTLQGWMLALLWLFTSVLPKMMTSAKIYEPNPINYEADNAAQMLAITKRLWKQDIR